MKCPNCGYHGVGNYCSECGTRLSPPDSKILDTRLLEERRLSEKDPDGSDPAAGGTPQVTYAGFWARVLAYILDGFIIGIPVAMVVTLLFGPEWLDSETLSNADLASLILTAGTVIFLWANWDGRTPGKKLLGIKIVQYPGYQSITYGNAIIRYFIGYTISSLILGLGFVMVAFRNDKRGLHDLIAKTCVIYERK